MKFKFLLSGIFLALSSPIICLDGILKHGVAHMQGRRPTMEDAHTSIERLSDGQTSLFAIFDGHGGSQVANYAAQRIQHAIERSALLPHDLTNALRNAFDYLDTRLTHGSLKDIAKSSGSTAVVALIQNNQLYSAHVGDSRAILSRNGTAVALTHDHKPDRPDEKARIEAAGGFVMTFGVPRVNGNLAVSRALGDLALRPAGVIAIPEINGVILTPQDEFLLLACDGVFEKNMTDQQAITCVRNSLTRHRGDRQAAQKAAQELIEEAYNRGSGDNISALVILLNNNQLNHNQYHANGHNRDLVQLQQYASKHIKVITEALPSTTRTQNIFQDLFLTRQFLKEITHILDTQAPTRQTLSFVAAKLGDIQTFIEHSRDKKRVFLSAYGAITLERFATYVLRPLKHSIAHHIN